MIFVYLLCLWWLVILVCLHVGFLRCLCLAKGLFRCLLFVVVGWLALVFLLVLDLVCCDYGLVAYCFIMFVVDLLMTWIWFGLMRCEF